MTSKFEVAQHAANNLAIERTRSLRTRAFFTGRIMAIGEDDEIGTRHSYIDSVNIIPEIRRPFPSLVSVALSLTNKAKLYETEANEGAPLGTTDIMQYVINVNKKKFRGLEVTIFTAQS